jgi:hypothetical protein
MNLKKIAAALAETVHEPSGVLHLIKAERAKDLHTIEEDVYVRYYTWKKGQGLVGQAHASSLQSAVFRRRFHLGAGSDGALRAERLSV